MEMLPTRLSKPEARTESISMVYNHKLLELPMGDLYRRLQQQSQLSDALHELLQWLNNWMPVQLVAYWNPRLGPFLLALKQPTTLDPAQIQGVEQLFHSPNPRLNHWRQAGLNYHLWSNAPLPSLCRLLLVEPHGAMSVEDSNRLLKTLGEALSTSIKQHQAV
ncbi:hypothetical protein Mmc1_1668 [Magnetococcus marinus MC-1]|uniref:Uncharacterized protein n=1 Tax=Magnetococcus marinus (strain ATCC BAA-1437 / JCM 17883 / MC-1) TaxID=156889 RepID=A0L884_MAGMM|nr:hypothetical protein [Magnetococcus marinus]ABK44177.1 hypothetical protein Mmc1_1668 [Magnetococcus marinus MC-1]